MQRVGKCEEVEGLSNKALYGQYRENTVFLAVQLYLKMPGNIAL